MGNAMPAPDFRPKVLFVDDEQRVLNSMRIMFRRQYELHLATDGKAALDIIAANDIDVIVADHRMPQMTGVELLCRVRTESPRTVRILLTGYADLDAVEGSINEGEVFRFLTKPCAPDELRETIALAATIAQQTESAEPPADDAAVDAVLTASGPGPAPAPAADRKSPAESPVSRKRLAQGVGVIAFTSDEAVLLAVQQAVRGRLPVYPASNIVKVVKILTESKPGVLLTDIAADKATIQSMTAQLKEHLPELVTIAVSPHRDVLDMVWLINHGQIFRFMRKPLSPGRCAVCLQAALKHHRTLLKHPELVKRHQVAETPAAESGMKDGILGKIRSIGRLWSTA